MLKLAYSPKLCKFFAIELLRQLPYSSRHLYRLGAMTKFPRRTRTGPGRTGYREAQIEE
jgi:predicted DNA-binding transcriptional regulator AlpA